MNLVRLLIDATRARPDHSALEFEGTVFNHAELDVLTNRCANLLASLGVSRGDVIALYLESCPELVVAYLGALKAGVVPNVVNASLKPEEVRLVVADSRAKILITDETRWESLKPLAEALGTEETLIAGTDFPASGLRSFNRAYESAGAQFEAVETAPEELASLLYTSGTTGSPKGVMLTHRNILDNAVQFSSVHYNSDDRLLIAAPLFHCWGLINGILGAMAAKATAIIIRRYRTEALLDLIDESHPTVLMAVPTMINYMAKSPSIGQRNLASLRTVLCAAAPMPLELIEVLRRDWKVGYAESYGLTETSPVITTTPCSQLKPGSCGRAMGDTVLKISTPDGVDVEPGGVGELWARGTAISAGYFQRPEATSSVFTPDGWFKTGDIVRIDDEGYVFIVDRAKDMINVGGEKVYPRDVEEVLHRHPSVADAVVVGVPDPDRGEVVKAFVVLKSGSSWTCTEVVEYLQPLVASFKLPRAVEFLESIPRSPSGKALRRLLR
ncbi:class I adenylate-forming enzyme family protein [Singulisphaera sp. PoT]|uniref:class I adenylate-forming enzyme family protein n=1 Tax=Singulisphaera sp. PoT TaxID=3411797 RepID=UPI003BF4EE5B